MKAEERILHEYRSLVRNKRYTEKRLRRVKSEQSRIKCRKMIAHYDAEIRKRRGKVERYVRDISPHYVREIIRLRYIEGLAWEQVADCIGGNNTGSGVRMIARRWFDG